MALTLVPMEGVRLVAMMMAALSVVATVTGVDSEAAAVVVVMAMAVGARAEEAATSAVAQLEAAEKEAASMEVWAAEGVETECTASVMERAMVGLGMVERVSEVVVRAVVEAAKDLEAMAKVAALAVRV